MFFQFLHFILQLFFIPLNYANFLASSKILCSPFFLEVSAATAVVTSTISSTLPVDVPASAESASPTTSSLPPSSDAVLVCASWAFLLPLR